MRPRVADPDTSLDLVRLEAAKLSFAPMIFEAARVLRDTGGLELAREAGLRGVCSAELAVHSGLSVYASSMLLEAGLAAGLLAYDEARDRDRFVITKLGAFWNRDPISRVNTDFVHHVCYQGAFHLEESLRQSLPAGLKSISSAPTVYEGLSQLEPDVRAAWFAFDHFYSDGVFESCLAEIPLEATHLIDIGGNTGRFTRLFTESRPSAQATIVDLPQQIALARENLALSPAAGRVDYFPTDVLSFDGTLPAGDVYWMSQFLDCFAPDEIVRILSAVRRAMRPNAEVLILETFWNRQRHEAARFCVIGTSLYFACIANGNSRMYHSEDFRELVAAAGLKIATEDHGRGMSHSLLRCVAA